jgi:HK97 gp10 family phage protein
MANPTNREFKVEGFEELFKAMDELGQEVGKAKTDNIWRRALGYAFTPVLESARTLAPTDTGQLRKGIYMKVARPTARDKASSSYKGEVFLARVTSSAKRDDSTVHTTITKKGKERKVYTNRPVGLAAEFGTADTSPQPYLRPSLESNADRVINRLGYSVMAAIEAGKWVKQKG